MDTLLFDNLVSETSNFFVSQDCYLVNGKGRGRLGWLRLRSVVRFAFVFCKFEAIKLFQKAHELEAAVAGARKGVW
jgi:hypothetical protein